MIRPYPFYVNCRRFIIRISSCIAVSHFPDDWDKVRKEKNREIDTSVLRKMENHQ